MWTLIGRPCFMVAAEGKLVRTCSNVSRRPQLPWLKIWGALDRLNTAVLFLFSGDFKMSEGNFTVCHSYHSKQKEGLSYAGVSTIFLDTTVQGSEWNIHFEELKHDSALTQVSIRHSPLFYFQTGLFASISRHQSPSCQQVRRWWCSISLFSS